MEGLEKRLDKEPTKAEILQEKIYSFANKVVWDGSGLLLTYLATIGVSSYAENHFHYMNTMSLSEPERGGFLAILSAGVFYGVKGIACKFFRDREKKYYEEMSRDKYFKEMKTRA